MKKTPSYLILILLLILTSSLILVQGRGGRGGGSRGSGSRGGSASRGSTSSRSRPSSSRDNHDNDRSSNSKPYPVQPSAPVASSGPGWNMGGHSVGAPNAGVKPPAPGWNIPGVNTGSSQSHNPASNPHWNSGSGGGGAAVNKPPAAGWNVGGGNSNPVGHNNPTGVQNSGWNTGASNRNPSYPVQGGGWGSGGGSAAPIWPQGNTAYGRPNNVPVFGAPPPTWGNSNYNNFGIGNAGYGGGYGNSGNRFGGGFPSGTGYGGMSSGNSKTGLLASAAAGAATVAGVWYLSNQLSPHRNSYGYGHNSNNWGNSGSSSSSNSGTWMSNGSTPPPPPANFLPPMACVGGTNNCAYQPTDVQCANITYNETDINNNNATRVAWQIACGDPKMSKDLCFSNVTLMCDPIIGGSTNGTTNNSSTSQPNCRLQYRIDKVKESNCTASLTYPEKLVSNRSAAGGDGSSSGSSKMRYFALLLVPLGLIALAACYCMSKRKSNNDQYESNNMSNLDGGPKVHYTTGTPMMSAPSSAPPYGSPHVDYYPPPQQQQSQFDYGQQQQQQPPYAGGYPVSYPMPGQQQQQTTPYPTSYPTGPNQPPYPTGPGPY